MPAAGHVVLLGASPRPAVLARVDGGWQWACDLCAGNSKGREGAAGLQELFPRISADLHAPLIPFCMACQQQVDCEKQTFVLCDICYEMRCEKVENLHMTEASGVQLWATGAGGFAVCGVVL